MTALRKRKKKRNKTLPPKQFKKRNTFCVGINCIHTCYCPWFLGFSRVNWRGVLFCAKCAPGTAALSLKGE